MSVITIGVDEVGRGAIAGPLVIGAVSLDAIEDRAHMAQELLAAMGRADLRDSKKLTRIQREKAFFFLKNKIIWAVGEVAPEEIDRLGLTAAVSLAAERVLDSVEKQGYVVKEMLADAGIGHPFEEQIPTQKIIKGDEKIMEITLASIMAKVWRDRLLEELSQRYPDYGFAQHVGYGTVAHYQAIKEKGLTPLHRRLFVTME